MKTSFKLHTLVANALPTVCDQAKLTQAIEAYLNGMKQLSEESTRGSLKEIKKSNDARLTEQVKTLYAGDRNIVSDFLQHHDRIVSVVARAEKLGCVVTVAELPGRFAPWLAKFAKADTTATLPSNTKAHKATAKA
jgi:hypothetical protein